MPEPQGRDEQRGQDHRAHEREARVDEHERDPDTEERNEVDERVDETVLQELRQRVDVAGHAGHDPARHLVLVVVDAEPLQVGEDLDAQRVEQPLGDTPHHARLGPHHPPVEEGDREEHGGGEPERARYRRDGGDAVVEAVLHEQRARERAHRVERDEEHPDEQPQAVAAQECEEGEMRCGPRLERDVDARVGVGGFERVDLGQELRGRRERAAPRGTAARTTAAATATRSAEAHGGGAGSARPVGDERAAQFLFFEAAPRRRRDAVDARVVDNLLLDRVDAFRVVARPGEQQSVQLAALGQLFVRSGIDDLTFVDDDDPIGQRQRGTPMRDEQCRARARDPAQRGVDLLLDARVDRRRGVVEQQDRGIREERAGQRDPLPLTARQREALLADDGVVAERELHDEFVGFGGAGRGLDFGGSRVGAPEGDVRGDRIGEQERVLEHHADAAPQRLQRRVAHVEPVDLDRAGVNVVEAREQKPDRRLPRARAADQRNCLARGDVQRKVAQHRLGRRVTERDVVEVDGTPRDVQHLGVGLVLHVRRGVEKVVDAFRAGAGELTDGQDGRELTHRRRDEEHVGREGEERSERDLVVQREPATERQHRDLTERGDRLHRRLQAGLDVHEPHARREHQLGAFRQAVELARLLPETLHDPHAGDVFLDDVGDVARLLLRVPARGEHGRAQLHRGDEQQRRHREHHQCERHREDEHDGERHDEQEDVRHADRQELQETLHQRDVGRRAAHELTRRHLVVAGEVEALQLPEDRSSEIVLDVERDTTAAETA